MPILTGSLSRIFLGVWTEQFGGRIVFTGVMLAGAVSTWLLASATTYPMFLVAAFALGIAGGSFTVVITYVSKWFPKERQGTALGIVGLDRRRPSVGGGACDGGLALLLQHKG